MSFTSFSFLFLFFPLCTAGYLVLWAIEKRLHRENLRISDIYLILASLAFYGWALLNGILYISMYIIMVYFMGKAVSGRGLQRGSRVAVSLSVLVLTGVLFFCKYYDFVLDNLNATFDADFEAFYIIALLGISFITFSGISYVVDIYRGSAESGNFLDAALYLLFSPR